MTEVFFLDKKILYVEDNQDTANAVKIILSGEGYNIDLAFDGTEGMKKAFSDIFDLILLDVMLPDMSGWEVYSNLKEKVNSKYAFLSAIPISSERFSEMSKLGVSDYIMKPFNKKELIEKVGNMLN
jgi:DNA-binding response OmpR family regulator